MKNFAITGVAGYIAPRHLQAIKDTGNKLVAALDINDSVGILDRYFPDASFFTEFERFERHLEHLKRINHPEKVDYVSICTPNFLHDAHIRLALRIGADAICEKPLVLNPWNLDVLEEIEKETGKNVFTILQLRVHPSLVNLKQKVAEEINQNPSKKYNVDLVYITSRGKWYDFSWKGNIEKSGGVATNIGIHLFDLLIWLFGKPVHSEVILSEQRSMKGELELENAFVNWFLSLNFSDVPDLIRPNKTTYRSIKIDNQEIEFTEGFTELHTEVYKRILAGEKGFNISDARPSIELVYKIRNNIKF
ncbi:MAG: Gfo/Idh/MocA family oxidoreductase [Ignavibacteria bacterium]|jgi:UDP-N-acetyl-2-amino-2-deoxyglucuronate dehydrogenase|nr:Gfo/Idh/MocA family oxidoreductase [Ignavibacteria bacterium]MDH7527470.1 Gfo/Idh/MocA family oxidoreductase [Ignavibacteria bacterium]